MPRAGRRVLPRVGALIEGPAHYGHLSGRENLSLLDASGRGGTWRTRRQRVEEALEQVGLAGVGRRPVKAYSLGMRQRLGLAATLLGDPRVLVLDEPANGLDPQGIRWLRDFLRGLAREGRAVLVSSHVLAEVSQTADDIVVIAKGRAVAQGSLAELMARSGGGIKVAGPDTRKLREILVAGGADVVGDGELIVRNRTGEDIGRLIAEHRIVVSELTPVGTSLEEVFFELTDSGTGGPS
jgi:ABC-2 type transport system ATP-binding protein